VKEKKNSEIFNKFNCLVTENQNLFNDNKQLQNVVEQNNLKICNLNEDKNQLIKQNNDLNCNLNEVIIPKLKNNENDINNLTYNLEDLNQINSNLRKDNTTLFNQNKILKQIINVLTGQNQTLIKEVQLLYNRDLMLLCNIQNDNVNIEYLKQILEQSKTTCNDILNSVNTEESVRNYQQNNNVYNKPFNNNNNNRFNSANYDNLDTFGNTTQGNYNFVNNNNMNQIPNTDINNNYVGNNNVGGMNYSQNNTM
jgi:hypothetical protein